MIIIAYMYAQPLLYTDTYTGAYVQALQIQSKMMVQI